MRRWPDQLLSAGIRPYSEPPSPIPSSTLLLSLYSDPMHCTTPDPASQACHFLFNGCNPGAPDSDASTGFLFTLELLSALQTRPPPVLPP